MEHTAYSVRLQNKIQDLISARFLVAENVDMTSTAGYDNDGSEGPELIDNGIGLAFACMAYDKHAKIFVAINKNTAYYQYGLNEDDAIRRLEAAVEKSGPQPQDTWCDADDADEEDEDDDYED